MESQNAYPASPTPLLRQIAACSALERAWLKVRANRGAAGIDAISLREFARYLEQNITELSRNLLNRSYEPLPSRNVNIPKPDGKERALAIPTVRDRVAQRAVLDAIEPFFEPQFLDCSYAFRPGRSVEMAVQKIIVARARGYRWTVGADIHEFFPSIDNRLLLEELARTLNDPDLLRLIKLWLDAGELKTARKSREATGGWRMTLASAKLSASDAVNHLFEEFLAEKLGPVEETELPGATAEFDEELLAPETGVANPPARNGFRRAAVRRLAKDGLLLALAERTALRGLLGAKLLGLGGAALVAGALAPPLWRKLRERCVRPVGALQGAPISPLLSNIYLHPFDRALTRQAYKLIRYCDDFVILCRSEAEAREALQAATGALRERRLELQPAKTRLVPPADAFVFLGYGFTPDGKVIAPPNVPEVVGRRVVAFADRATTRAAKRIGETKRKAMSVVVSLEDYLRQADRAERRK